MVNGGELARAEGMLIAQAHTLDNIFSNLARRATNQEYLKQWETYMRMAMKAQNQCRMTLETLAAIKNPPVVFARQANINNGGQQQVNNGVPTAVNTNASGRGAQQPPHVRSPAANSETTSNELLEQWHGERLDAGATGAASGVDSVMAPVGAGNGTSNAGWQGTVGT